MIKGIFSNIDKAWNIEVSKDIQFSIIKYNPTKSKTIDEIAKVNNLKITRDVSKNTIFVTKMTGESINSIPALITIKPKPAKPRLPLKKTEASRVIPTTSTKPTSLNYNPKDDIVLELKRDSQVKTELLQKQKLIIRTLKISQEDYAIEIKNTTEKLKEGTRLSERKKSEHMLAIKQLNKDIELLTQKYDTLAQANNNLEDISNQTILEKGDEIKDLNKKIDTLKSQIQLQLQEIDEERSSLNSIIKRVAREMATSRMKLEDWKRDHINTIKKIEKSKIDLQEKLKVGDSNNVTARSQLENEIKISASTLEELRESKKDNKELRLKLELLGQAIAEKDKNIKSLISTNAQNDDTGHKAKDKVIKGLRIENENLMIEYLKNKDLYEAKDSGFETESNESLDEIKELKKIIQDLQGENDRIESHMFDTAHEKALIEKKLEEALQSTIKIKLNSDYETESNESLDEIKELKKIIQDLQGENDRIESHMFDTAHEKALIEVRLEESLDENNRLRLESEYAVDNDKSLDKIMELKKIIQDLQNENDRIESHMFDTAHEKVLIEKKLEETLQSIKKPRLNPYYEMENNELLDKIITLKNQNEELIRKVDKISKIIAVDENEMSNQESIRYLMEAVEDVISNQLTTSDSLSVNHGELKEMMSNKRSTTHKDNLKSTPDVVISLMNSLFDINEAKDISISEEENDSGYDITIRIGVMKLNMPINSEINNRALKLSFNHGILTSYEGIEISEKIKYIIEMWYNNEYIDMKSARPIGVNLLETKYWIEIKPDTPFITKDFRL